MIKEVLDGFQWILLLFTWVLTTFPSRRMTSGRLRFSLQEYEMLCVGTTSLRPGQAQIVVVGICRVRLRSCVCRVNVLTHHNCGFNDTN